MKLKPRGLRGKKIRNKEDGEKEDKLGALQQQVDANKAQIKQLQKMLAEIIQKVCYFSLWAAAPKGSMTYSFMQG